SSRLKHGARTCTLRPPTVPFLTPCFLVSQVSFLFSDKPLKRVSISTASAGAGEMDGGMDELTREFLIESQEGLDRMERCLTELETRPSDAGLLGDIFRSVH